MSRLVDKNEMQAIYDCCVRVYSGEIKKRDGCAILKGKTHATESSLLMYFNIYSCMRNGTCYKMGTSAAFTRFLIESIRRDYGYDAFVFALASAKQNAEYRIRCGNEQPGIEATCRDLIDEYELPIKYEDLTKYYGVIPQRRRREKDIPKGPSIKLKVTYGDASFTSEGPIDQVLNELHVFSTEILPKVVSSLANSDDLGKSTISAHQQAKNGGKNKPDTEVLSPGKKLLEISPSISDLASKKDFKARMIPLMFLADETGLLKVFSLNDIQRLMCDTLGEIPDKKQIESVLSRRADWFDKVNQNPRKYILLEIAKDYARNILSE